MTFLEGVINKGYRKLIIWNSFKVILNSYLILKKMNERITDS